MVQLRRELQAGFGGFADSEGGLGAEESVLWAGGRNLLLSCRVSGHRAFPASTGRLVRGCCGENRYACSDEATPAC